MDGPFGLGLKAVPLRDAEVESSGLIASDILPVLLIQESFALGTRDLASFEHEESSLDLGVVTEVAIACARCEDELVFNGAPGVSGLLTVKGANEMKLSAWDEVEAAGTDIVKAMTLLDDAGFHGPYALALAPARFNLLLRLYPRGNQTELEHVRGMVSESLTVQVSQPAAVCALKG